MGLDICFSRVNKIDYSLNKETAINDKIEIGHFYKVNCLLPHFGYVNNVNNCEYIEIEKMQIEDLLVKTKELLQIYGKIHAQLVLYKHDLKSYERSLELSTALFTRKDNEDKCKLIQQKIDNLWEPFETAAKEKLPTTLDFFTGGVNGEDYLEWSFGSQDYRDWYLKGLMEIVEVFEKILDETDFDVEQVLMWCSW